MIKYQILLIKHVLFSSRIMFDKNHAVLLGIDLWEHG
jgi:hypothetical protein